MDDMLVFNRMFRIGAGEPLPPDVLDAIAGLEFYENDEVWAVDINDKTADTQREHPATRPDRREQWAIRKSEGNPRLWNIWCVEYLWMDHAHGIHTPLRVYVDAAKTSGILDRIEHARLALLKRLDRLRAHLATPTDG